MTPIRRQYLEIKRRFPETLVLFRLGDFYETFDGDADICARELNLTLTSRPLGKGERVPMAGIPHHALAGYLRRLIRKGYRVAICDQVGEKPGGRALVAREVTRVVTPGTVLSDDLLGGVEHNFLAAVVVDGDLAGLAYADVSTGSFTTMQIAAHALADELARVAPAELIVPEDVEPPEAWTGPLARVRPRDGHTVLLDHFGVSTLEAYGCEERPLAIRAAACVLLYLRETQPDAAAQLTGLRTEELAGVMTLDGQTRRNLEIFESARSGDRSQSVRAVIDRTVTPMGARLLQARLGQPLRDVAAMEARLDQVDLLLRAGTARAELRELLARVPDLSRLAGRAALGIATPRDLAALGRGLSTAGELACVLNRHALPWALVECGDLAAQITATLADDPPPAVDAGGVIRPGFNLDLDETRGLAQDARTVIASLERGERERTGIKSLRVTYNRVFGYSIEVSAANLHLVPAEYQRRQTLSGGERFITPELKEYETRVLGAQERMQALEAALFRDLCARIGAHAPRLRELAETVAELDLAASHAETAALAGYCRPVVDESDRIEIVDGRHAVIERMLPAGSFVPNDTQLSAEEQITVLTGPNMAGKSTYLRQIALIVLLAQTGCYVPARAARIGVVDRIFTRIGAQDDLAAGSSTFMVEMVETAQILHHATPRSLVILDEVGRGTSTYDGLALARAIIEYLHNQRRVGAKTLFATHYHELTELARSLPRVRNASVAVVEQDGAVAFLRRIVPGGADRSYGVHVAQLAGMPRAVVERAETLLAELEAAHAARVGARRRGRGATEGVQMPMFGAPSPLVSDLAQLDVDALTPLQALTALYELRARARSEQ